MFCVPFRGLLILYTFSEDCLGFVTFLASFETRQVRNSKIILISAHSVSDAEF